MSIARQQEPEAERLFSVTEAARYCRVGYKAMLAAIWDGQVGVAGQRSGSGPGGRNHVLSQRVLDAWLQARQRPAGLLTMLEAAERCGVAYSTIRTAIYRGTLTPDVVRNSQKFLRTSTLDAWLARHERPADALTTEQARDYCRVDYSAITSARRRGELTGREVVTGPRGGRAYVYTTSDLDDWLERRRANTTVSVRSRAAQQREAAKVRPPRPTTADLERKRAEKRQKERARREAARRGELAGLVRCVNCRECVQRIAPDGPYKGVPTGVFDCRQGYWGPKDQAGVGRLHPTMAEWCTDFARREPVS